MTEPTSIHDEHGIFQAIFAHDELGHGIASPSPLTDPKTCCVIQVRRWWDNGADGFICAMGMHDGRLFFEKVRTESSPSVLPGSEAMAAVDGLCRKLTAYMGSEVTATMLRGHNYGSDGRRIEP